MGSPCESPDTAPLEAESSAKGGQLPEETTHGDYPAIVEMLIAAGARLPDHVGGSDPAQDVLRRFGVPDAE